MKINVSQISFRDDGFQQYDPKDSSLINPIKLQRRFGLPEDYIELHVYDLNNQLLKSNYNYQSYKSLLASLPSPNNLQTNINIDPAKDAQDEGYKQGSVQLVYNIFRKLFGSASDNKFYIKTISSDRTELRIANNNLSNDNLTDLYNNFLTQVVSEAFYKDFYLNFGNGDLVISVNVILEQDPSQFNLLIKLYEPLPPNFQIKDQFWLVDELSEPNAFQVDFVLEEQDINSDKAYLRGPNFNIKLKEETNPSIDYVNYNQLFSTTSTSSYQQLKSMLEEKSLEINVDYENYENFVHFSSAKERLANFTYKLKLVEDYTRDLNTLATVVSTPQISSSKSILSNNINNIIEKFDGYEYFLYFESGSKTWPKKNNIRPYLNYEITSSEAILWLGSDNDESVYYGGQVSSASFYDNENQDNLLYTIPEYLRIDSKNKGYEVFVHMIGQHFDNIWLYSKAVTDIHDASNNIQDGISKDLVSYALKSLGVKLYTNTSTTDNVFSYLLGITPSGSLLPTTGSELITNYVTASNVTLPGSDIDKEVYKRIYHNLPFLLKTKGTERGLRALMACYGIPDTILHINEFGGTDKDSGSIEQFFDRLSYAFNTKTGSFYISTPWAPSVYQNILTSSGEIAPDTIEFRFKTMGVPSGSNFYSQSLFQVGSGSQTQFGVQLLYTKESNSGSYRDYGDMRLVISGNQGYTYSQPIHLPFFDNGWWNVMVLRETGSIIKSNITSSNTYWVYAANSIYKGHDGDGVGFVGSSSLFITGSSISSSYHKSWNTIDTSSFRAYLGGENSNEKIGTGSNKFAGFYQELRYWVEPLPVYNFLNHTLNPLSYESTNETSSYNSLIFRVPLGNDLLVTTSSTVYSVHPTFGKTGSFMFGGGNATSSHALIFAPGQSLYGVAVYGSDVYFGLNSDIVYTSNINFYYLNAGNMGLGKPTNNKIRVINQDILSGSTLSPYIKIEQSPEIPFTKDVNTLEIAISPNDQINNDIINQLGYFDIDEFIGDPREANSREYLNLKKLREAYFKKYFKSYNLFDLIRIVKYYNNSLFKMIKDFIPARTNASTGIVIKPHILERSKQPRFNPNVSIYNNSSGSIEIGNISAKAGGTFGSNLNYDHIDLKPTLSGSVSSNNNKKWEIFTGELGGSRLIVHSQSIFNQVKELNSNWTSSNFTILNPILNNISQSRTTKHAFDVDYSSNPFIAVNLGLITESSPLIYAPVQDSNYTLARHINPRYVGSKTISQLYNVYTEGDKSYGKTAAVDKNVRKLGLFTNISSSQFFPQKSEIAVKYLIDEFGGLTELNTQNNNWFELQNTFKATEQLTVAQFDPLKYGYQRKLDGNKVIFTSGYSYDPIFYYSSSDSFLTFNSSEDASGLAYFKITNSPSNALKLGVNQKNLGFQIPENFFDFSSFEDDYRPIPFLSNIESDISNNIYISSSARLANFPSTSLDERTISMSYFSIPFDGIYSFAMNIKLSSYVYEAYTQKIKIHNANTSSRTLRYYAVHSDGNIPDQSGLNSSINLISSSNVTSSGTMYLYSLTGSFGQSLNNIFYSGSVPITNSISNQSRVLLRPLVFRITEAGDSFGIDGMSSNSGSYRGVINYFSSSLYENAMFVFTGSADNSVGSGYDINLISSQSYYAKGNKIVVNMLSENRNLTDVFYNTHYKTFDPITLKISSSISGVVDLPQFQGASTYPISIMDEGSNFYLTSFFPIVTIYENSGSYIDSLEGNLINFTSSIANIYNSTSSFVASSSSLYSVFGDVEDVFRPKVNDAMLINSEGTIYQFNITNVSINSSGSLSIGINPPFLSQTIANIKYVLILKRTNNETNAIINYTKRPGPSSYGFVIPNNLHPDVMRNIDVITKEVKTKLLELGIS